MMKFDIITIFPDIFRSYLNESIISRAINSKKVKINFINLRDFTEDKHKTARSTKRRKSFGRVDDRPYGGGPGMVFKIEPLARALGSILNLKSQISNLKNRKTKIILFSASGKQFNSKIAALMAKKYNRIIMIAGHYEGIDGRIKKVIKDSDFNFQEISIGPYVLTGGELPAMVVVDAISRHIPGVLGKSESLEEKRFGVGVPVYTRPEVFKWLNKKYQVPKVLLSGDHKKIEEWRKKHRSDILF